MLLVYTGQEAGNTKRLSFFEKDLVEWKDDKLFDIYSKLFQLKKNNAALQNGERGKEMIYLKSTDENNVLAFSRGSRKDKVVAVFNLSNKPVSVVLSGETLRGSYKNFISGKLESISTMKSFNLNYWEYRIYIK